jgi:C-terminal processing protease CtpA/Prc
LVLKLSTFQNLKYKPYYKSLFSYLENNNTDTLFIDLRNNTGGNFYHAYHLLNYICNDTLALTFSRKTQQGSRYFKGFQKGIRLFYFFHREVSNGGKIEKRNGFKYSTNYFKPIVKHHFKGKVVVLANGLSMSSSTIVAYYLKHKANATIIGEPGGGEFGNCGGAFPKVKLPNTKMKINFPGYWMDYHLKL